MKSIDLKIGYTVGYGTKDHSIFPFFCAIAAALYGEGRPVRLANDRYEQFQMALKRHAFWMDVTLVVDRTSQQVPGHDGRYRMRRRRAPRIFRPSVGMVGATRGAVDLLPAEQRFRRRSPRLARRRCRLDARLRHAADHGARPR